eukprot:201977_1
MFALKETKKLQLEIRLCEETNINGTYSNDTFPSGADKISMRKFLSKQMNFKMNNGNDCKIHPKHIFIHESFYNKNTPNNYILFLYQNQLNMLKNKWYIAKYNVDNTNTKTLNLLYVNTDRISSTLYFPPSTQWKIYQDATKHETIIKTFDPDDINLDYPLIVLPNHTPSRYDDGFSEYKRTYNNKYNSSFNQDNFDNIYDKSIKYKAIDDVQWYSNAHSWYKHLSINGEEYRIYPDYNAMTRGYSPGTRHERQIRWSMTGISFMYRLKMSPDIHNIIQKYGNIYFNRAFCGIKRCHVSGHNIYGENRYKASEIYKDDILFTKEESEQQIENAVRAAFTIHNEIIYLFDKWKYYVLDYWIRIHNIKYIVKEIKNIIRNYIFLEYEKYAFEKRPVYEWDQYKTNRYFRRLCGSNDNGNIKIIDGLFDKYVIAGRHLLNLQLSHLKESNIEDEGIIKIILDEINNLYSSNDLSVIEFIEYEVKYRYYYFNKERVKEIENKMELNKLKNIGFYQFKEYGYKAEFYSKMDVSDKKVIHICQEIHKQICKTLELTKDKRWF